MNRPLMALAAALLLAPGYASVQASDGRIDPELRIPGGMTRGA
jgi:hypothetical protein